MRRKKRNFPLPNIGDAFLMPLSDGRFGVCRVVRASSEEERMRQGHVCVVVAASPWIGAELPDVNDPRLRDILTLTHHSHNNSPATLWLCEPPPTSFIPLGVIAPSVEDSMLACLAYSGWEWFGTQLILQWRWDHEQEAVLREDERKRQQHEREREEGERRYQEHLAGLALETLRRKRRFTSWRGYAPGQALDGCRRIFRETIDALIELGPQPKLLPRMRILRRCIQRLNALDEQYDYFIDTLAREDLCEEFDEIVYASGLHECKDLAGRWRDW